MEGNTILTPDQIKRNVMIPIDPSEHCERAFNWYFDNLYREGDEVIFVHVIEPVYNTPAFGMAMAAPVSVYDDLNRVMEGEIQQGKKLGQKYLHLAKEKNVHSRAFLHIEARPGHSLVKSARDHRSNIIVMGNRGIGTLRRTFLGSVSDYVLHHAHIPVVIIPPPGDGKDGSYEKME